MTCVAVISFQLGRRHVKSKDEEGQTMGDSDDEQDLSVPEDSKGGVENLPHQEQVG